MKKLILVLLLVFSSSILSAAEMDEAKFKVWMKGVSIDGYKVMEVMKEGSDLVAMLMKSETDIVQIALGNINHFKVSTSPTNLKPINGKAYTLKGMKAAFGVNEQGSILMIEAKNINKSFTLGFSKKVSQDYAEKFAEKSGLFAK